jgi:hypothetical protein
MNKYKLSKNLPQIPINENYKEKIFSLASSHELAELEDFITTNSISLKIKNEDNETITHVLLKGENTTPENELLRCIKFLVERGAPISSIDKDYLTPLFICIKKKYSEIFKYLLSQHANTDIKTYDNLNVLHEIAKPEHTIFDPKGIQDLIPERLPKITMEGYDDVYKEIQNKVQDIDQNLETFRNIATQFYDIDNKEDFNNILLIDKAIEEPGNIYTVQNELFDKLKNNLLENEKKDDKDDEEEGQLDRLLNELQIEINKDNMLEFNTQLESSILNLAKNLELCIHYFFLKKPENTNIAIEVIIALAKEAKLNPPVVPNTIIDLIRYILFTSFEAVREVILSIITVSKMDIKDVDKFITEIRQNLVRYIVIHPIGAAILSGVGPGGPPHPVGSVAEQIETIRDLDDLISQLIILPTSPASNATAAIIGQNMINALAIHPIAAPELPGVVNDVLNYNPGDGVNIQRRIINAPQSTSDIVQHVNTIKTEINIAIQNIPGAINAIAPANAVPIGKRPAMELKVLAVLQTAIRSAMYATVYAQNEVLALPPGGGAARPKVANISAIYAAVDANVLEVVYSAANSFLVERLSNQDKLQQELQEALSDKKVAIEAIVRAGQQITLALLGDGGAIPTILNPNNAITPDILINAIEKALRIPHFLPQHFKLGDNYNNLIESYKLINIPQRYINFNLTNKYSTEDNTLISKNGVKDYKLTIDVNRSYAIDYFNLLYTFNQYVKNCYVQIDINKNNIFTLYQNIQQIYKYKYIIYIFNKQKEGIEKLLIIIPSSNNDLVKNIKELLEKNYNVLKESVARIENHLSKIITLANECIKSFNNFNASKIEKDIENNISIGIYPEIEKDLNYNKIEYTFDDENEIIANYCRNNYVKYNEYKQFFFHNFVLFFQEIGKYDIRGPNDQNLLNDIPNKMDYNIDINNHTNRNPNTKNKAYKLYFYNPKYLKKHIQEKITELLGKDEITRIVIQNFKNNNLIIKRNFTNNIKNFILNEILEEKFYTFLTNEINNVFKKKTKRDTRILVYTPNIKKPNLQQIILVSAGFGHSLNPNYEFQNNKFFSISKNRFLEMILYFDTNYFKQTNFDKLEYYKDSKFINILYKNNLLLKSHLLIEVDMKGWTPIYYAIDGNNYKVIRDMLTSNKDILIKYDNKQKSPIHLCINNQLQHLNYLLNDDDKKIHFLDNYKELLRKDLSSNDVLIPLNIDAVFNITLHILNNIFKYNIFKYNSIQLPNHNPGLINSRKYQINNEYKKNVTDQKTKTKTVNDRFNNNDDFIKNDLNEIDRPYTPKQNIHYNYINDDETNDILRKYYNKARDLEMQDFGLYGTYWNKFKIYKLNHIKISKTLKKELKNLINTQTKNIFNQPEYDNTQINKIKKKLGKIDDQLSNYLNFINIRFNTNKDNAYRVFLNKIYVHVLANIIGVDFYLRMEELIIHNYISLNIVINDTVKEQLRILNKLLINNKLDPSNINYLYIIEEKNPELVLKDNIKKFLESLSLANSIEIINTFETKVYPNYRDLYKITYKYLKMFISNYHKFIYNQYHRLDILMLLLNNLS